MIQEKYLRHYGELEIEYSKIKYITRSDGYGIYNPNGIWRKWATSSLHLIDSTFGKNSVQSANFKALYDSCGGSDFEIEPMLAVFKSAKSDFEAGFASNVELRVSGEVFGDFIVLARQSLTEGHKNVAAVLACAALEGALKKFASTQNLVVAEKDMTEVINALKSASLISGPQKSLIDAMPRIRNAALHAEWDKIGEPEVNSVIGFVEQFLLTKFG